VTSARHTGALHAQHWRDGTWSATNRRSNPREAANLADAANPADFLAPRAAPQL